MFRFANLNSQHKIGVRIYAGFGIVLALLLLLATLGYFSLSSVRSTFEQYAFISRNTLQVAEVDRGLVSLRRNLREYIRTNSKESLDRTREVGKDARQVLGTLATTSFTAEQREQAQRILASLDEFMANVEAIVKIQAEFNHVLNDEVSPLGTKLSAKLTEIVKSAMDDSDMSGAADAGVVQEQLMLARLNVSEFLQTDDAKLVDKSEQQFITLLAGLKRLNEVTNDDARQAEVAKVIKETPDFVAAFRAAVKVIAERARLVDDVNSKLAADMSETMEEMKTTQVNGLVVLKGSADTAISSTIELSLALAGLAQILGTGIAWIIGRGITNPIKALTHTMDVLAKGDLQAEVPGTDRGDELGQMAISVLAFKESGLENSRLQSQAAEAENRAAAEHAVAEAKVLADLDEAVGGLVKAAIAGDFSLRVPLEGKERAVRNLAEAMNTMCENVGQAMEDLVAMLTSLAHGDLTHRIDADYQGTFLILKDSANATAEKLTDTISGIKLAAEEVTNVSTKISTSTTDLSQRTEEQAASLEETSASMEQVSVTVKKNAENTQQANQLTHGTREVADRGGQVVAHAVEAMSRIEESSRKISDIIGVIDEIARQTNLLALNAAVEAARAGEAGRGFAVVASEVRSLAQRSSQAAKDIKDLIIKSNSQVKEGVELVNRAGTSLNEIVQSIKSVANIMADIATASAEQAAGLDQINKALAQMDEVTQQNSALVEENAAAAKMLEHQCTAMGEQVSFFQLDSSGARIVRVNLASGNAQPKPASSLSAVAPAA
jgi:methyl-accepting chemotaxis protein